jgi:RNA polymerase sigma-70 factor (ECF subfamily)
MWDENKLVLHLKQGDEEAFRLLIQQYREKLYNIAYGITLDREDSLDIVQDVFLKVHQNIRKFRGTSKLSTWLYRITVNQSLNWKRRWKRRFRWHHRPLETDDSLDYPELGTDEYYPEKLYQNKEFEKSFREKLRELPEDARAVFVLKEIEGLSYGEIAKTLKLKRGTVSSRLFYARQKLKESLEHYLLGE